MSLTIYNFDDFFKIEEIRKQCKIWHEEDDEELKLMALAALENCEDLLGRVILKAGSPDDSTTCADSWPVVFNNRIRAACLLMISDLYENREVNTSYNTYTNPTFERLLAPLKDLQVRFQ